MRAETEHTSLRCGPAKSLRVSASERQAYVPIRERWIATYFRQRTSDAEVSGVLVKVNKLPKQAALTTLSSQ